MSDYKYKSVSDTYKEQDEPGYQYKKSSKGYEKPTLEYSKEGKLSGDKSLFDNPKAQAFTIGTGYAMDRAWKALKDAGLGMAQFVAPEGSDFENNMKAKRNDLALDIKQAKEDFYNGIANEDSDLAGWARGGEFFGEVAPSIALPGSAAKTLLGRGFGNGAIQGAYELLTTAPEEGLGIGDRLSAGATGFVGGSAGSVGMEMLGKGGKAALGKIDPVAREVRERLVRLGLKPQLGDLVPPSEHTLIRSGENFANEIFGGTKTFKEQAKLIDDLVVNPKTGENIVKKAVDIADDNIDNMGSKIWKSFDDFISNNKVPGVRPINLKNNLDELLSHDKSFLNNIPGDKLRARLQDIADTPINKLKSLDPADYIELNRAIGKLTPAMKAAATPIPGASKVVDQEGNRLFSKLLKGMDDDMSIWGSFKGSKEAFNLYKTAKQEWTEKVLPWRNSDIVSNLKKVDNTFHAPDTIKAVSGEADRKQLDLVRKYMREFGTKEGADVTDALYYMNRAANEAVNMSDPARLTSHISLPEAIKSPLAALSRNKGYQNYILSDGKFMVPRGFEGSGAPYKTTAGVLGGLARHATQQGVLSSSREGGENELAIMTMLADILHTSDEEKTNEVEQFSHGIGPATQQGAAGR